METHSYTEENIDKPERIFLENDEGWFDFDAIPYPIYYSLNANINTLGTHALKKDCLYSYGASYNQSENKTLNIFIQKNVPHSFKDIIFFHELIEAKLSIVDGIDKQEAHKKAVIETNKYAKKHLSLSDFQAFKNWETHQKH